MADYVPPPGPPPPKVPEGWKAQWNDQYKEWFYVNLHTKQSQWDRPTEPVYGAPDGGAPPGPPPTFDHNRNQSSYQEKGYGSNNPYASHPGSGNASAQNVSDDEAYARKLQEEENARAQVGTRGAQDSYYNSAPQYGQQSQYGASSQQPQYGNELPPRDSSSSSKGKGLLGKLLGKTSSSSRPPTQQYYSQGQGAYSGYPQQQQQGGYYGQGAYPQQQYGQPQKKSGGLGVGGGAALGLGAGVIGGALMMDAIDDHQDQSYNQGYDQGYDNGNDNGNDDMGGGGDDGGGGDF